MIDDESLRNGTATKIRVSVMYFAVVDFCSHKKTRTAPNYNFQCAGPPTHALYMIFFKKSFSTPVTCPALAVTPTADRGMLCILALF